MAGLIGLTAADIDIQDALRAGKWEFGDSWIPRPVVRLTTTLPVAVERDGERRVVPARWGFDVGGGRPIGNARDDRLLESPMWRALVGKTPCLFVTTGVYEMVRKPAKRSLWFRRVDGKPIVMPGLCGERGVKGEKRLCAAIVTTAPNKFFGRFHDRQVCVVDAKGADAWLRETDPAKALTLLRAPPEDAWEAVPIDDMLFGKGRREMEHLVETGDPIRWDG